MLRAVALLSLTAGVLAAGTPACDLVAGWTPQGDPRNYTVENLYEYMDGNSEGYFLYGFRSLSGVTCVQGDTTLVIDISDFGDADSAYGMFCANRDLRQPMAKIGMGGQIVPRRAIFTRGPYYVEIAANPEGDYSKLLGAWTAAIEKTLGGETEPPAALKWFPAEGQQSLRLVPESPLGIRLLKRGYVAEYAQGKAFVVTESSAEMASALLSKLKSKFEAKGDQGFEITDKYLGKLSVIQRGRYLIGATGNEAPQLAKSIAARLP